MRLFVGNLPFSVTQDELRAVFAAHATVRSATIVMDRATGRPRGFGFVEIDPQDQGADAPGTVDASAHELVRRVVDATNGLELKGRALSVSEAKERPSSGPGR